MPQTATRRSAIKAAKPTASDLPASGTGRLIELDAARSMLMMLGVIIHAANPYAIGATWIVTDSNDLRWLYHLQHIPHSFRMPGFFLLAGFLGTLALNKRGVRDFLGRRAARLLWPVATALLTINAFQYWYVQHYIVSRCTALTTTCAAHATPGLWVAHLWFLFFLMGYSLLLPSLVRISRSKSLRSLCRRTPLARAPLTTAILTPLIGTLALKACSMQFPWLYNRLLGIGSLFQFLEFGLYFALGVLIALWPGLRQRFVTLPPVSAVLLTLAGLAAYFGNMLLAADTAGNGARLSLVLGYACTPLLVIGVVRLFMLLSHKMPRLASRAADSAYTVYLFHHLIVVVLALALVDWIGPSWVKFLLVCTVAGGGSYLLHRWVIGRSAVLRLLYNGVR